MKRNLFNEVHILMREHTFKFIDQFNMENQISDLGKLYRN